MLNIDGVVGWIAGLVVDVAWQAECGVGDRPPTTLVCQCTYLEIAARSAATPSPIEHLCVDHYLSNVIRGLVAFYRLRAGVGMQWRTYHLLIFAELLMALANPPTILFSLHLHCSRVQIDSLDKERTHATTNRLWCRSRT